MIKQAVCFIIPPHIFQSILENGDSEQKRKARKTLMLSEEIRQQRLGILPDSTPISTTGMKHRLIYDGHHSQTLPGKLVLSEGQKLISDEGVHEVYEETGMTYDLYLSDFKRNSIDDHGMDLISTVHYEEKYDNAFWDGKQMVYGDGDGQLFGSFTKPVDITGHELTHGVTQFTANLDYQDQPGALNESFSDIFGTLVKQKSLHQKAEDADWLIGNGIFTSHVKGTALRSMKAPGTAYDDPILGKDPQPSTMEDYRYTNDDNGGVHINSGIPNKAFALASLAMGGYAWEKAGQIWYEALTENLKHNAGFQDCADVTYNVAGKIFGSIEQKAVKDAWHEVGIII